MELYPSSKIIENDTFTLQFYTEDIWFCFIKLRTSVTQYLVVIYFSIGEIKDFVLYFCPS